MIFCRFYIERAPFFEFISKNGALLMPQAVFRKGLLAYPAKIMLISDNSSGEKSDLASAATFSTIC